jgi:hypothetical protein
MGTVQPGEPPATRAMVATVVALLAIAVTAAAMAGPWNPPLSQDRGWRWAPLAPDDHFRPRSSPAPDPMERIRRRSRR